MSQDYAITDMMTINTGTFCVRPYQTRLACDCDATRWSSYEQEVHHPPHLTTLSGLGKKHQQEAAFQEGATTVDTGISFYSGCGLSPMSLSSKTYLHNRHGPGRVISSTCPHQQVLSNTDFPAVLGFQRHVPDSVRIKSGEMFFCKCIFELKKFLH